MDNLSPGKYMDSAGSEKMNCDKISPVSIIENTNEELRCFLKIIAGILYNVFRYSLQPRITLIITNNSCPFDTFVAINRLTIIQKTNFKQLLKKPGFF